MGAPLSEDLRRRIVEKSESGYDVSEISEMFNVSICSVYRFRKLYREQGNIRARKLGKPAGSKLDVHRESIQAWIKKQPALTLEEMSQLCAHELGMSVHHTTLLRVLRQWGYRYKKNDLRERTKSS